ncbi:MAG: hypothetical protein HN591_05425 [Flavobacteriales bacterium]|nr:hypothetical protein [Flavobacteriales bacterium]
MSQVGQNFTYPIATSIASTFNLSTIASSGRGSFRISGTIDENTPPGIYNFTVTTSDSLNCISALSTGTFTVVADTEIDLSPGSTISSTICFGGPITPISFTVTNSIGFPIVTGLPAGLGIVASGLNTFEIQGSLLANPGVPTTIPYTISASNPNGCDPAQFSGSINIQPSPVVINETAPSTLSQNSVCNFSDIQTIEFSVSNPAFFPQLTPGSNLPPNINLTAFIRNQTTSVTLNGAFSVSDTYALMINGITYTASATDLNSVGSSLANEIDNAANNLSANWTNPVINITHQLQGIAFETTNVSSATMTLSPTITTTAAAARISGTVSGTVVSQTTYSFGVEAVGGSCTGTSSPVTGFITVNPAAQAILATGSDSQIICDSSPIVNISYNIVGATSITTLPSSNNPSWLNGNFVGGVLTLSGSPNTAGEFEQIYPYQYALIGSVFGCVSGVPTPTLEGTITVSPDQLVSLQSGSGSISQTICEGDSINPIFVEYYGSATGVNVTGLPPGVSAKPAVLRTAIRELTLTQPVGVLATTGSETYRIRINGITYQYSAPTLVAGLNSSTFATQLVNYLNGLGSTVFTASYNTASGTILITQQTPGAPLAVSDLSINESFMIEDSVRVLDTRGLIEISGTPNSSVPIGNNPFFISSLGTACNPVTLPAGNIEITSSSQISRTSAINTENQSLCNGDTILDIQYTITGTISSSYYVNPPTIFPRLGLGASINNNIVTISGTLNTLSWAPTTYQYEIFTSGNQNFCSEDSVTGSIIVNPSDYLVISSPVTHTLQNICLGNSIEQIDFEYWGGPSISVSITGLPPSIIPSFNVQPFITSIDYGSIAGVTVISETHYIYINGREYNYSSIGGETPAQLVSKLQAVIASDTSRIINASISGDELVLTGITSGTSYSVDVYVNNPTGGGTQLVGLTPIAIQGPKVLSLTGTPTAQGNYTVSVTTVSGTCGIPVTESVVINVLPNASLTLISALNTDNQSVCQDDSITDIEYRFDNALSANIISGLPPGVFRDISAPANVVRITGTPSFGSDIRVPRVYRYIIETSGSTCSETTIDGFITVQPKESVNYTGSNDPLCQNASITPPNKYTFEVFGTNDAFIVSPTINIPFGLSSTSTFTVQEMRLRISGNSAQASEVYIVRINGTNYSYSTLAGGETPNVIAAGLGASISNPTISVSTLGGDLIFTGPNGFLFNAFGYTENGNATINHVVASDNPMRGVITITGTATAQTTPTTYNIAVQTRGTNCTASTDTLTLNINSQSTIQLISGSPTETVCDLEDINDIVLELGGGAVSYSDVGAGLGWSPSNPGAVVLWNSALRRITVDGTPNTSVTTDTVYTYTFITQGNICTPEKTYTVTLTVLPVDLISVTSGVKDQAFCETSSPTLFSPVEFTLAGGSLSASVSWTNINPGLSLVRSLTSPSIYTLVGNPSLNVTGTTATLYPYTITTSGTCNPAQINGVIQIQPQSELQLSSTQSLSVQYQTGGDAICNNDDIIPIVYDVSGGAVFAGTANVSITWSPYNPFGINDRTAAVGTQFIIDGTLTDNVLVPTTYTYVIETINSFGCVVEKFATGRVELLPSPSILPINDPANYVILDDVTDNTCNFGNDGIYDGRISIPVSPTFLFNQRFSGGTTNVPQVDQVRINYLAGHPSNTLSDNDFIRIRIQDANGFQSNEYVEDKGFIPGTPALQTDLQFLQDLAKQINDSDPLVTALAQTDFSGDYLQLTARVPGNAFISTVVNRTITPGNVSSTVSIVNAVANSRWYYDFELYSNTSTPVVYRAKDTSDPSRVNWDFLEPDEYVLEVAITNGFKRCSSTVTLTVEEPPLLALSVNQCSATMLISATGGTPTSLGEYTYVVFDSTDNVNAPIPGNGALTSSLLLNSSNLNLTHTYVVQVIDSNGCTESLPLQFFGQQLEIKNGLIEPLIVHDNCSDIPADIGTGSIQWYGIVANAIVGGSGQYTFEWSAVVGSSINLYTTPNLTDLLPGRYTLTVTDDVLGCQDTHTFELLGPPQILVTPSVNLTSAYTILPWTQQTSTSSTTSSTGTSTNSTIDGLIVLCPDETVPFLEVSVNTTTSTISSSSLSVGHTTSWYRNYNGTSLGAPNDRITDASGFGPGIYEARVTPIIDGTPNVNCTISYFIELRETDPIVITELTNLRVEDYCVNDGTSPNTTLTYYISGGVPNDTYSVVFNGGAITGSSGTNPREIVINVDPTLISQITTAEVTPSSGCSPITVSVSSTLHVPERVTISVANTVDIDCAQGQLGRITLNLDTGDIIDLSKIQIQWQGSLDDPSLPGYNSFLPWDMTGYFDSNSAAVPFATLFDIRYAGTYRASVLYQTASSTCFLTDPSNPLEVVVLDVAREQLIVDVTNVVQPGCGESVGSIALTISNAQLPTTIIWEKFVELELFTSSPTSSTASGTTSLSSSSTTNVSQQWQELTNLNGLATAFPLDNGIYRATISDQRGASNGICPSGAVRTRAITIGSQGVEIQNATIKEIIPDDCGSDDEITGNLNFRVESNIPSSGANTFDVEITGNNRGLVYSSKTSPTTAADGVTFVRRGQNYTFSGLKHDTYTVVASLPTGTATNSTICDDTYIFKIDEYLPLEYTGDQEFFIDECTGIAEITADVSGGVPFVVDGQAVYQFNWTLLVKDAGVYTGETINFVGQTIEVDTPGELSLVIYDSNNCYVTVDGTSAIGSIEVSFESEPFKMIPDLVDDDGNPTFSLPPNCGSTSNDGSIGFKVEGGTPPYTISWYVEDPLTGRTSNPHIGYRKLEIENRTFSKELDPGNYKIVIESQNSTCGGSNLNRFEQNIVVPINKDLYIIDGPFVDEDLCKQLPGRIVIDIFDNIQGDLTFYYNNQIVDVEDNRISDNTYTVLIPLPVPDAELKIVNDEGCTLTANIILGVGEPSFEATSVNFKASGSILAREQVTFENRSTDPFSVSEWIFGDNTPSEFVYVRSETTSPTTHEYGISGTYFATLRIYNDIGCSQEVTQPIIVGQGYNILVPNVFSPNGDLVNDRFKPLFSGFGLVEFTIYDNRGNKVYYELTPPDGTPIEPDNYSSPLLLQGWDGSNAGNAPYYIYTVRGITLFGEKEIERSGTFIILR